MTEEPLLRYIGSFPNPGVTGIPRELFYPDTPEGAAVAEAFAAGEDRPGRAVYDCVSLLRPGVRKRCTETVAAIPLVHADIDTKDVEESKDEIVAKLLALPYPPSLMRDSGHGIHPEYHLKEPVEAGSPEAEALRMLRTRLTEYLCADPNPDHHAALLRRAGTTNSKNPEALVPCRQVAATGQVYDLGDIADLLDDCGHRPLFTRKEKPAANGRAKGEWRAPVDVAERLAKMEYEGERDASIHRTQLQVSASELRNGCTVDFVVEEVLEATKRATAGDERCAGWNWTLEEHDIRRMCFDFINDEHPELYILLPDALRDKWEEKLAAGRRPHVFHSSHIGWHVRSQATKADEVRQESETGDSPQPGKPRVVLRPFVAIDEALLPRRRWLYGKHYQRRVVSATVAPGGTGKTSLVMVEAVAMATARNLLGDQPEERCRVWLHNGEDALEELHRRVVGICRHYGIPQEELQGWLHLTSGTEMPLKVAHGYSELKIDTALVSEMTQRILDQEIDAVMLDPLITLHSTDESSPGKMDPVVRIFTQIADVANCAIDLSAHTRKLPAGTFEYTMDDMRGASSVRDAVRALRVLNIMSTGDGQKLGLDEMERLSYFRVDRGKTNATAPSRAAVWRKFENVHLANGDDVGVVTPWTPPDKDSAPSAAHAAQMGRDEEVFLQLLDRLTLAGRAPNDRPGPGYAPNMFAEEREARAAKVSKKRLADAMRRLIETKRVRVVEFGSPTRPSYRLARENAEGQTAMEYPRSVRGVSME